MPKGSTLEKIQKEIEGLTPQEQLKLLERITHLLKKAELAGKKRTGLEEALWTRQRAMERRRCSGVC